MPDAFQHCQCFSLQTKATTGEIKPATFWTHATYHWAPNRDLQCQRITESVDSVCRDGTDMPYVAIQTQAWKSLPKHSHRLSKVPDLHHGVFCNQQDPRSWYYYRTRYNYYKCLIVVNCEFSFQNAIAKYVTCIHVCTCTNIMQMQRNTC